MINEIIRIPGPAKTVTSVMGVRIFWQSSRRLRWPISNVRITGKPEYAGPPHLF